MEEGPVRDVLVGLGKGILVVVSLPSWLLAAFFLGWFWPAPLLGRTCDPLYQEWCEPGWGMPQYVTVAVLIGLSSLLLLTAAGTALTGSERRRPWLAACVCAVLAGAAVTVVPALLEPHAPHWWFMA